MSRNDPRNQASIENPSVGDYWEERFTPYFLILDVQGDKITLVSAFAWPAEESTFGLPVLAAKQYVSDESYGWTWDLTKYSVVSKEWIADRVMYKHFPGFVADVHNAAMVDFIQHWQEQNPDYIPIPTPKPKGVLDLYWLCG